jgi:hypothetical protein
VLSRQRGERRCKADQSRVGSAAIETPRRGICTFFKKSKGGIAR